MNPLKTITEMKREEQRAQSAYIGEIVKGIHERLDGITKRLEDQHAHQRQHAKALDRLERERQAQSQILKALQQEGIKRSRELERLEERMQAVEEQSKRQVDGYRSILEERLSQLKRSEAEAKRLETHILLALGLSILSISVALWAVFAR